MSAAAELFVRISADVGDFKRQIASLPASTRSALADVAGAADSAASSLKHLAGAGGGAVDVFKGALGAHLVADGLQAIGRASLDAAGSAIKLAANYEESEAAFTAMLGSAEKATRFLGDLSTFAAHTPFELPGLEDASRRLLAFGFDAKSIIPVMTGVGNAMAVQGGNMTEKINGVTLALGQMAAKGKVSAEEMNQLIERGVNGWKYVAKEVGVSVPEAMKLAEKGSISAGKAISAIVNGMNKEFGGAMEAQAQRFNGAMSNLHDSADGLLRRIGASAIKNLNLTPIISTAAAAIAGLSKTLDDGNFDGILTGIKAGFLGIATAVTYAVAPAITATLIPAIHRLALAWAPAIVAAAPFIALAGAVAFAAIPIMNQWEDLKVTFRDIWGSISDGAAKMWNQIRSHWARMAEGARNLVGIIVDYLRPIADFLKPYWNKLPEQFRVTLGEVGRTAYHLPGEIATNLAAGNGPVLGAARDLGREMANNLQYAWGGVGDSVTALMSNVKKAMAGGSLGITKLTEDLLGLNKGAATGAGGAAKHVAKVGDAAKQAAYEAKVAMENIAGALRAIVDLSRLATIPGVLKDMGRGLADVDKHATAAAAGFNKWDATAKVLAATLKKLEAAGLSKDAGLYKQIARDLDTASQAASRFQKQQADLGDVFTNLSRDLTTIDTRMRVYGSSYDALKAQAEAYQRALDVLTALEGDHGEAIAFNKARLDETNAAILAATPPMDTFRASVDGAHQAFGSLRQGLTGLGEVFALELSNPAMVAMGNVTNLAVSLGQVATAAPAVIDGFGKVAGAITLATGPAGLFVAAIGAVLLALSTLGQSQKVSAEEVDAWQKMYGKAQLKVAKVAEETVSAIDGQYTWLSQRWLGYIPPPKEIARPFVEARRITVLEEMAFQQEQFANLRKGVISGFQSAGTSAIKAFLDGSKPMEQALRESVRDSITSGIIDAFIKRGFIEGALGGQIDVLVDKLATGADPREMTSIVQSIGKSIPGIAASMEAIFTPLQAVLKSTFSGNTIGATMEAYSKARGDIDFKESIGSVDAMGALRETIGATEKALGDLRAAGAESTDTFKGLLGGLTSMRARLDDLTASAAAAKDATKAAAKADDARAKLMAEAYAPAIAGYQRQLAGLLDAGKGGSTEYQTAYNSLRALQAELSVPALASGGLVTAPTLAMIGEGRTAEAVLPLNDEVYRRLASGIAGAGDGAGGSPVVVNVNYTGNGKWTSHDAEELGALIVASMRRRGVGL